MYGRETLKIQAGSVHTDERVVLIDDLLATGETALAAVALIERLGGRIVEIAFVVQMLHAGGRKKLLDKGPVFALTQFNGA